MSKTLGWFLFLGGLVLMSIIPLAVLFIPSLSRIAFLRPQTTTIAMIIGIAIMFTGLMFLIVSQDKFSEKRKEIIDQQFPCPVCKKDVFTWGKVPSSVVRVRVGLGQPAWARICLNCGNVQQFTKTD